MLTGAARRGAASCGSLLIAAVPSSPIESDGFPTSSCCGARRRRRRAGRVLRVGMFAVLFAFGVFVGVGYGGAASDGSTGLGQAPIRLLRVFRGVRGAAVSTLQRVRSFISRIGALIECAPSSSQTPEIAL